MFHNNLTLPPKKKEEGEKKIEFKHAWKCKNYLPT